MKRRFFSRGLMGAAVSGILFPGCKGKETPVDDSAIVERARRYAEQHILPEYRAPFIETAQEVAKYYSTSIVRERHGGRLFEWPVNYAAFNAKKRFAKYAASGRDGFDFPSNRKSLGQWSFFWPDFNGYDQENWMNEFDPRKIEYVIYQLHSPESTMTTTEQSVERLHASKVIESQPGLRLHGLDGYRWVLPDGTPRDDLVEWVGRREDGRLFRMSSQDPGKATKVPNPLCNVSMFDADTGEEVAYRYSLKLFEHWRSIEDRTRKIIRSWQIG